MSVPAISLNARVHPKRLLDLLGCKVTTQGLPIKTRCPICEEGVLNVTADQVVGGAWYSCRDCGRTGDMIELAAATWKLTIPDTLVQLKAKGFELPLDDAAIKQYVTQHVEYRQRLRDLWTQAKGKYFLQTPKLRRVGEKLKLGFDGIRPGFEEIALEIVGGIHKDDVERGFAPGVMENAKARNQKYNSSSNRVFTGKSWGDVLTIPFCDAPGRISSFLFAGRDGDPTKDIVLKRANQGSRYENPFEGGLAFHPDLLGQAEHRDRTIVALHDPFLAVRLQVRHSEMSLRALPLVTWLDSTLYPNWKTANRRMRTHHAWGMLQGYRVVFWMPQFCLQTVRQAILVDGDISTAGPNSTDEKAMKQFIYRFDPNGLFCHFCKLARPWRDVLSEEMAERNDAGIERILVQLQHEGDNVEEIVSQLRRDIRERVTEIQAASDEPRRIALNGDEIIESNREWRVAARQKSPELITNVVLRMDGVASHQKTNEAYIRGRLLHGDREIRFVELYDRIDRDPIGWMRELLMRNGVVPFFNRRWKDRLMMISQSFQEPVPEEIVDEVGWDRESLKFILPNFSIGMGGDVEAIDWPMFPDDVPGKKLGTPQTVTPAELGIIGRDEKFSDMFWATAGCIIANIVAPAFNKKTAGICLTGQSARDVGEAIAKAMGCLSITIRKASDVSNALEQEQAHGFPVLFDVSPTLQRRFLCDLFRGRGEGDRNCIVVVDDVTANAAALRDGWHVVSCDARCQWSNEFAKTAQCLITDYLRDLCVRRMAMAEWSEPDESFVSRVIRDLAQYADRHHGDPGVVLSADNVLRAGRAEGHPAAFAELLQHFIDRRSLRVADKLDGRGLPTLVRIPDENGLWISYEACDKLFRKTAFEPLDSWQLQAVLAEADALLGSDDDGVMIDREWLEKQWRRKDVVGKGTVKLHG